MAYVAPATWLLNTTPTAAQLNQELRDNLNSLRALNDTAIRVHRTATQSIPNNTRTGTANLSWQATQYQVGMTWSSGTNPTRITVPTTGVYLLVANIKFANVTGGRRGVGWRANGGATAFDLQLHPANGVDTVTGIDLIDLVAGDYIEIFAYQNSGGALNTAGTTEGDCWAHLSLYASGGATAPAWVPPLTWVDGFPGGTFMSPARLNTQIRDEVISLRNFKSVGAMVWLGADLSISQNTRGKITWDQSTRNVGGIWDGGSKFIAPIDGVYLVTMDIEWADAGSAGVMGVGYRLNDTSTAQDLQFQEGTVDGELQSGGDLVQLQAGEFLEFYAFQDSPEAISIHGGTPDRSRASVTLWAAAA